MSNHHTAVHPSILSSLLVWYGTLSAASLDSLERYYAPEARFRDPFNDVYGTVAIRAVFLHMFETVEVPHFEIDLQMINRADALVSWTFTGKVRRHAFSVPGCTRLRFDEHGQVADHQDFWDAASLWRQVPLIRVPVSWLCKRFSASKP